MTNSIQIVGRLTKDPQSREAGTYTVASFSVACDNKGKDKGTTFFDVQAWGKTGEFVMNYLGKGRLVFISGSIESRKHEDKTYWTVNTTEVKGLDRPRDDAPKTTKTESEYDPFSEDESFA